MTRRRARLVAITTVLSTLVLGTPALPAGADNYPYSWVLEACSGTDCAERDTRTTPATVSINTAGFTAGGTVNVTFDVDTSDSSHAWLNNNGQPRAAGDERWESGRKFQVAIVFPAFSDQFGDGFSSFDCYDARVAQNSPLVRSSSSNPGVADGSLVAAESHTHAAEPFVGGMLLELSNPGAGNTLSASGSTVIGGTAVNDTVKAVSSTTATAGSFSVDATLPSSFPALFQAPGEAFLCVQSVDLYGDEGNLELDANDDGDTDDTGDVRSGIGFHCPEGCLDDGPNTGSPVRSQDGMCNPFCETYNSTPRIQSAVRVKIAP